MVLSSRAVTFWHYAWTSALTKSVEWTNNLCHVYKLLDLLQCLQVSLSSAMHRFFTFEDLIHELCSYLSPVDLSILACVSSIWFRHAISRLYKEVSIENALAPMGELARQYDDSDLFVSSSYPKLPGF